MVAQGADILGDRHVVVVVDHEHVEAQMTGVIQCFECHAGGHAAVTDHRDHAAPFTFDTYTGRHAGGGRDGRLLLADAEAVVFAFGAPAARPKPAEPAALVVLGGAPRGDFGRVSLMAANIQ